MKRASRWYRLTRILRLIQIGTGSRVSRSGEDTLTLGGRIQPGPHPSTPGALVARIRQGEGLELEGINFKMIIRVEMQ